MGDHKEAVIPLRNGDMVFSPSFGGPMYKAFQLDEKLLAALSGGETMCLKGIGNDALVLCTGSKTYAIQLVETSNSVLLCSDPGENETNIAAENAASVSRVIEGIIGCTHELKQTAPRLGRLRDLLEGEEFYTPEDDLRAYSMWDAVDAQELTMSQQETQALFTGSLMDEDGVVAHSSAQSLHTPKRKRQRGELESCLVRPRDGPGYTLEELEELVQASRSEILGGLSSLGAMMLDPQEVVALAVANGADGMVVPADALPRYRLLDPDYTATVLNDILTTAMAESWHPGSIPLQSLTSSLEQHPVSVVAHVARLHAGKSHGRLAADAMDEIETVSLDYTLVALCRARVLLESAERSAEAAKAKAASVGMSGSGAPTIEYHAVVADFVRGWQRHVDSTWPSTTASSSTEPGGCWSPVLLNIDILKTRGIVVVDTTPTGVVVLRHFPADRLPPNPRDRFKALFALHKRWSLADITPFIQPLVCIDRKQDDMLVAHCRSTLQPDGSRLFSER